jgi:ubiquinone/menaquinone biosynthesis C-methylase UbiE
MNPPPTSEITPQRIMQFAWSFAAPTAIEAALHNGLFDALDSGPKDLAELEKTTGCSARGLSAIADFLVGIELLKKDTSGRFTLTPESETFLVKSKPSFHGAIFRPLIESIIPAFLELNSIVRTGRPAQEVNSEPIGSPFFQELVVDLFPMNYAGAKALAAGLAAQGLPKPASVLDLATGSGVWGIALAQASPSVRVTAVDWPPVLEVTRKIATRFGVVDRFDFSAGDLLEADFGANHGLATLGHILHSEGEERSRELLKKTFHALAPGGVIAIAEFLVNADRTGPLSGLIFSINMLVNTESGRTYSFEELSDWLRQAGFIEPRLLEVPAVSPLVLANKPS